jgi:hypothetical protein
MTLSVGKTDGDVQLAFSFETSSIDQVLCQSSFNLTAYAHSSPAISEAEDARKRYTGTCIYDDLDINTPSRIIRLKVSPVTDKDLFSWDCSATWADNEVLSAMHLLLPFQPNWKNIRPEDRVPEVRVVPRQDNEQKMKIACVIPHFKPNMCPYST